MSRHYVLYFHLVPFCYYVHFITIVYVYFII